jgi:hypothetical protein
MTANAEGSTETRYGRGAVPYLSCRFQFSVPGARRWSAAVSFIAGSTVFSSNTFELPGQGAIPNKGRSVALKLLGAATGGSIMMFDETVPAGTKSTFYLHHDSDKVAYVLSGEVRFSRAKPRGVTARHSLPLSGGPGGVVGKVYVDRFCDQDALLVSQRYCLARNAPRS